MTITDEGRFDQDTKEDILDYLVSIAASNFGTELDPDEVSVLRSFYDPVAEYFAGQQQDLSDVLDSVQLAHAEGAALGLLTQLVGVARKEAEPADTVLRFSRENRAAGVYTIADGSQAQTDETSPIVFETDKPTAIRMLADFESGNLNNYVGNTGDYTVQTTTVYDGTYALEGPAIAGSHIYRDDIEVDYGCQLHGRAQLGTNAIAGLTFGVTDKDNQYQLRLDDDAETVSLISISGGTETTLNSTNATLPVSEWLDVEIDWRRDHTFTATVWDAAGVELASFDATDSNATYETGSIGFASEGANAAKYFDNYTMSAASAPATSTTAGSETNVAQDTLTVMPNQPAGVESVTNTTSATGGQERENDANLRARAQDELSDGMRATQRALINQLDKLDGTRSVTVIVNDTDSTDGDGRPSHSFEAVVETDSENYDAVAQRILDTKAGGDIDVGGYDGTEITRTADLPNHQSETIAFSVPSEVTIYVDVELSKTDTYVGDDAVKDAIVRYIGGTLSGGARDDGDLNAGDDVIYNSVVDAVMGVEGVYDVTSLTVGTSDSPTGTANISIADTSVATTDGSDSAVVSVISNNA